MCVVVEVKFGKWLEDLGKKREPCEQITSTLIEVVYFEPMITGSFEDVEGNMKMSRRWKR